MRDLAAMEPLLIPTPQSVKRGPGWVEFASPQAVSPELRPWIGQARGPEAYRLIVASNDGPSVTLEVATALGEARGRTTLRQLTTQYGMRLPELVVEDWPSFAARGVMLDVSRDRVPTMADLAECGRSFAGLKLNHAQLYTEHTFAYAGHETVWEGWSPMTPQEVRQLASDWGALGIDLAANQNCFGHLASWLRHDKYKHLAETHGDWVFDVWPRSGPFSLCPTDTRSLDLVEDLLGQLLPCFTSGLVNIGCDETYDIAYGRSAGEVAKRGRAAVFLEFVQKICRVAEARGKRPMFWADIALSHPECVPDIPPGLTSLAWGYEPDAAFARWCDLLCNAGREVWVCPGTSSWRSITGRTTERRANIDAAADAGGRGNAAGFLICDWGDTGHHQQWPIALHGIAYGAAKAWNADAAVDLNAESLHVFGDRSLRIASWLDELGDIDLPLRQTCGELSAKGRIQLRNQSALFIDMHKKLTEQTNVGSYSDWIGASDRLEEVAARRPAGLRSQLAEEIDHTLSVARFAAMRASGRRGADGLAAAQREELRRQLQLIIAEHRRLWLLRSREGGLEHSCGYYRAIDL